MGVVVGRERGSGLGGEKVGEVVEAGGRVVGEEEDTVVGVCGGRAGRGGELR